MGRIWGSPCAASQGGRPEPVRSWVPHCECRGQRSGTLCTRKPACWGPVCCPHSCRARVGDPSEDGPVPTPASCATTTGLRHAQNPERVALSPLPLRLGPAKVEGGAWPSQSGAGQVGVRLPKESICCSQPPAPADTLQDRRTGGRQPVGWRKGSRRPAWRRELRERLAGEKGWPAPRAWSSLVQPQGSGDSGPFWDNNGRHLNSN